MSNHNNNNKRNAQYGAPAEMINVRQFKSMDADELAQRLSSFCNTDYTPLEKEGDDDYDQPVDTSYIPQGVVHDYVPINQLDPNDKYFFLPNNHPDNLGKVPQPNNLPKVPQHPSGEGSSTSKVVGVGNVPPYYPGHKSHKAKLPSTQQYVPKQPPPQRYVSQQPRPQPKVKRTVFLHQGSDDRDLWPDGMRWTGRDGGEDGRCYYIDQYGVRWQSEEGCTHGTVTEM